ncbi:hypothetical protein [Usitatibacter palustris]|uniref:Uncharacterized protein n=1 Tax=Usitatibacter palustris TaxID=2732487 RepID=A0A6M4HCK6_9PROT|nr:hypothetical protein [Usitatibacter palustris]QJR16972.1 hypothetical protein DSM104440_03809 [Usitatibacter palustris]
MKRNIRVATIAAVMLASTLPAYPQEASQQVQQACRRVATYYAQAIMQAKRANQDPASAVTKVAESWAESVLNHMLFAASKSDSMTEAELGSLGYSYCVARRPMG